MRKLVKQNQSLFQQKKLSTNQRSTFFEHQNDYRKFKQESASTDSERRAGEGGGRRLLEVVQRVHGPLHWIHGEIILQVN